MKAVTLSGARKASAVEGRRIKIESYVPYLINRAATAMLNYSADEFEKIGLTVPQWRMMFALWDTGGCRFGTLAELTSIEPPTLSRLLNVLEAQRLVRRRRNPNDTRSVSISLTAAGKTRFESTIPFAHDVNAMYLAGVSKADVNALRRAVTQIYHNITRGAHARL